MNVLAIDIGGTWIKVLVSGHGEPQRVASGSSLTPQRMVEDVKSIAAEWNNDVVSIG